jgi:hypothetical protein
MFDVPTAVFLYFAGSLAAMVAYAAVRERITGEDLPNLPLHGAEIFLGCFAIWGWLIFLILNIG